MLRYLSICLFLTTSISANAENVFYCHSELATGFLKENNSWKSSNFEKNRFSIKFNDEYSTLSGLEVLPFECLWSYGERSRHNTAVCTSVFKNGLIFIYNIKTKKFLYSTSSVFGYTSSNLSDTSEMYAGSCTDF